MQYSEWEGLLRFLDRSLAMQSADRGLKDVITSSTHGHDRVAQARARMAPLVTQLVHRAQAAAVEALDARRHFILNVTGLEHRPRLILPILGLEPVSNSLLAVAKSFTVASIHSK